MTDETKPPTEQEATAAWKKYNDEKAQFDRDFIEVLALEREGNNDEEERDYIRAFTKIEKALGIISRSGHDHWHPEIKARLKETLKRNFAAAKGH